MTLAIGTALQNGTYVIDALGREDVIGPGYLAIHVPSGQWVLVRVLGSRHPEAIPSAERRLAFYDYLEAVGKLGHPLLSVRLQGFEEDGVCYQILPLPLGVPFTDLLSGQGSLSPRRSLTVIQQLADALEKLRPLGWHGLQLTPDQLWMNAAALGFVGFDLPATSAYEHSVSEAKLVQGLTHLLYFLLTGQRAEHTQAPLAVDVRHRLPGLPISLETALHHGSQATIGTIQEWLAMLPPLEALPSESPGSIATHSSIAGQGVGVPRVASGPATQVVTSKGPWVSTQVFPSAHSSTSHSTKTMPGLAAWSLVVTGLIAGVSGLTLGLQARIQPSDLSNPARFNPNQSFPPLPDWRGGEQDWSAPASRRRFQPDYGDAPIDQSPVLEPEASPPVAEPLPPAAEEPVLDPWEDNLDGGVEDSPALPPDDPLAAPDPLPTIPAPFEGEGYEDDLPPTPATPVVPNGTGDNPEPVAPPAPLVPAPAPPPPLTSS